MALVLAITADRAVADLCRQALTPSGHAVVEATDAAAAMRSLATLDVDVIFLDSTGCDSDLEDFWGWLQSGRERSRVPVLFLVPPAMRWVKPLGRFRPGIDGVVFRPRRRRTATEGDLSLARRDETRTRLAAIREVAFGGVHRRLRAL
ncbi:MAG: hypothetical protein QME71_01230 [Dehalococcoidia bacterium]|nr:hypothetical protein [Dehalococcoidia bacterium]